MARTEKTVFISYRRKDISWALAVYQFLTGQKYDVFFDFSSIPSGDFEQIIVTNIRARAHFVLILTPTALNRADQPKDWLRREIETAMDEKRNIIPLFFDGFNFGSASVTEKLTGNLANISRYNGLDIPSGYFMEAMERLCNRYLNVSLDAVIHPVSTDVRKKVKQEQVAAIKAFRQKQVDIHELVKPAEQKANREERKGNKKEAQSSNNAYWKRNLAETRKGHDSLLGNKPRAPGPGQQKCFLCFGRGTLTDGKTPCSFCRGTGVVRRIRRDSSETGKSLLENLLNNKVRALDLGEQECSLCSGKGTLFDNKTRCFRCGGTGVVKKIGRLGSEKSLDSLLGRMPRALGLGEQKCLFCSGRGTLIDGKTPCSICGGTGVVKRS